MYFDPHGNVFVTDRRVIAKRFARSWFIIDLTGNIPWDQVVNAFSNAINASPATEAYLKLIKMLRIFQVRLYCRTSLCTTVLLHGILLGYLICCAASYWDIFTAARHLTGISLLLRNILLGYLYCCTTSSLGFCCPSRTLHAASVPLSSTGPVATA